MAHPATGIKGRGTAEMKTNDVTGRFQEGEVGFVIEVGRPGVTAHLAEVERITTALFGRVVFEPLSPITALLDVETGQFRDEGVRNERVLSAIIECKARAADGVEVLRLLQAVSQDIQTVFSLGVIARCTQDGEVPFKRVMEAAGFLPGDNGKVNVGIGRPLA
jgi:hypothetical protein